MSRLSEGHVIYRWIGKGLGIIITVHGYMLDENMLDESRDRNFVVST